MTWFQRECDTGPRPGKELELGGGRGLTEMQGKRSCAGLSHGKSRPEGRPGALHWGHIRSFVYILRAQAFVGSLSIQLPTVYAQTFVYRIYIYTFKKPEGPCL